MSDKLINAERRRLLRAIQRLSAAGIAAANPKSRATFQAALALFDQQFQAIDQSLRRALLLSASLQIRQAKRAAIGKLAAQAGIELYSGAASTARGLAGALATELDDLVFPLQGIQDRARIQFRAALAESITSAAPTKQIAKSIQRSLALPAAQAKTLLTTAISAIPSEINTTIAEQLEQRGEQIYLVHTGPAPLREFCDRCYKKAFTLEQVNSLVNGQGISVRQYVGGYNCRHTWRAIPAGMVRRFGFPIASDEFVSSIVSEFS